MVPLDKQTAYSRIQSYEAGLSRRMGLTRAQRYDRAWRYYSGTNIPIDDLSVMPLGINLAKIVCDKQSSYVWGQWQNEVVHLRVLPEDESKSQEIEACNTASDYLDKVFYRYSDGNRLLRRASLNASIFGDAVIKVHWDPTLERGKGAPVITSIRPEYVHFRWDPHNDDVLTEVIIAYEIDRNDAIRLYKTPGNLTWRQLIRDDSDKGFATYWERWTPEDYEVYIDDIRIDELSGPNPYKRVINGQPLPGAIPFVHIKNLEGDDTYGFSDAEPIMMAQDELNRKLSDEGDTITNHAHPIILIRKYFNGDVDELPVGPDQVWDMGREGEAEYLSWDGPQPETHKYLQMVMTLINDLAGLPPAAFGRAEQSQLSGIAAQMAMLPLTEKATDKRIQWTSAFRNLTRIIGTMLLAKNVKSVDPQLYLDNQVDPQWFPILPKDREAEVDENLALFTGGMKLLEDALDDLGTPDPNRKAQLIIKQQEELVKKGILKRAGPAGGGPSTGMTSNKSSNTASTPSK